MTEGNRKLAALAVLLGALHAIVLSAGFFAPYSFVTQDRELPFAPPSRVHFIDRRGEFHWRPFVYGFRKGGPDGRGFEVDFSQRYPIHFFVQGSPYRVAIVFNWRTHLFGVEEPGRIFLLGSDAFGRDQFSRFLYGGQLSLLAGVMAAALSVVIGIALGGSAGFYGGRIDDVLMRGGELFLSLPWLYLLFAVRAALPLHIAQWQVFLLIVAALGLIGWPRPARLVRGIVLSAKERNFVIAARGFGASDRYLLQKHILPQTSGVVLTQIALLVPQYILAEVTLTFLGLGVGEPMPSWGSLLSAPEQYSVLSSYWWMFLPAALLMLLFLGYYAFADALEEHSKSVML